MPSRKDTQYSHQTSKLSCGSCDRACLYELYEQRTSYCPQPPFFLWPEKNYLMKLGINRILYEFSIRGSTQRTVFIDFRASYINEFLNEEWLLKFKKSRLVLICDRKLGPLANYWFYSNEIHNTISCVIYADEKSTSLVDKIQLAMNGKFSPPPRRMERLSLNEFKVLQQINRGVNAKKIALTYNYSVKTVYSYKTRIERKLRMRLGSS